MKNRVSELDGIRALAVIGVLYTHYADGSSKLGHIGVRIFFVLSAFLITDILRNLRDVPGYRLTTALKIFYTHRAFRILPAYYLMIAGVVILERQAGVDLYCHASFMTNFWFAWTEQWQPWQYAALWTLSVEMQFYLVWPLIVLTNDDRRIAISALVLISIAVLYWVVAFALKLDVNFAGVSTPASLDALAAGALACLYKDKLSRVTAARAAVAGCLILAMIIAISGVATATGRIGLALAMFSDITALYPIALLITVAACGTNTFLARFLSNPFLVAVGMVSYGIYLYHLPVLALERKLAEHGWPNPPDQTILQMAILSPVTFLVAALSFFLFERPLQRFGHRTATTFKPRFSPSEDQAAS